MSLIDNAIVFLIDKGIATVVLPFILIFTLCYGILNRIKLFGKGNYKNYNALISFCLAFFTIYNFTLVDNLPMFIARIAILFILIVSLMILSGFFNLKKEYKSSITTTIIGLYILFTVIDIWFPDLTLNINQTFIIAGMAILAFAGIVWFIVRTPKDSESSSSSNSNKGSSSTTSKTPTNPIETPMTPSYIKDPNPEDYKITNKKSHSLDDIRNNF